ncbi:MAG: hypothetical protein M3Z05_15440 [Gemmatimonadota bacterium]|nr:hypothetical protein [Gemmatimonadota bacterium]
MSAGVRPIVPPIAEERLRVMPGIGGIASPITVVGLSITGNPLIKLEVELRYVGEATTFVRSFLARRDGERRRA